MKLYSYFRSSCSYRLRIALNLKGLEYEYLPVNLLKHEQRSPQYLEVNPLGLVPALEVGPGEFLGQSVALLEWLEEEYPQTPLLPAEPLARARVRSAVNVIACDIQPLCNLGVTGVLQAELKAAEADIKRWYITWMHRGFIAFEQQLSAGKPFCFGDTPGMADVFLVPQVYNAHRMGVPLDQFPHITRTAQHCSTLPAFADAAPELQPDSTIKP
jgi:maleylacetoacetate isomerase